MEFDFKTIALCGFAALIIVCVYAFVWGLVQLAIFLKDIVKQAKQDNCEHQFSKFIDDCPGGSIRCSDCDKRLK